MSSSAGIIIFGVLLAFVACGLNIHFIFQASTFLNFEIEKCPFCYNETFCNLMHELQIRMTLLEYILGCINNKYVFFGVFKNKSVAIKRLAHRYEIDNLDAQIASNYSNGHGGFDLDDNLFYTKSLALLNQSFNSPAYKLRLCPTLNNADSFFEPIVQKNLHDKFLFVNMWTSLQLNPEPLILQIFSYDENWPVPKYIGSCGRIALVENSGKTIQSYLNHPWLFRVHIVEELLWMAHNFTFSSPNFGIYLRDVSPDNIIIDSNMKTRIVDLEHVIVVDKKTPKNDQPSTWLLEHQSEHFFCDNCLVYSAMEICEHHISDHNFYAVCKEFLNSIYPKDLGLLHSAPNVEYMKSKLGKLKYYAEECIQPSQNVSRFEIVNDFRIFLHELKAAGNFSMEQYKKLI